MNKERNSRFAGNITVCSDWAAVMKVFDQLPTPSLRRSEEGEAIQEGWIFRGHKRTYPLAPSIEREYPSFEWAEAEYRVLREFRSKAPLHLEPSRLPPATGKLPWLALMQHLGVPTRLLDFTYSPYVALYFALRHRGECGESAEVWGIDAAAVRRQAERILREADEEVRKRQGQPSRRRVASMLREDMLSPLQAAQTEDRYWESAVSRALNPCGLRREHFNHHGLVAVALPPIQNLRLSSQQGVFLFNGAEDHLFEESLELMMRGLGNQWYKRFHIPAEVLGEVERQLFQLNVHDLSLFPDAEGLTGFVRQRIRLHW